MRIIAYLYFAILCFIITSCAAPNYLSPNFIAEPEIYQPTIKNTCYFGLQNMDEEAKVDGKSLTCHYNGFDVQYMVLRDLVISMEIINNTNKSLIIDKSKSYVLYDGYSNQLFKDVRSSRSTTFNNVQDAINNVQTNEAGVLMTIPPYAKWELPLNETNVRSISKLPDFIKEIGPHSLSVFDNKEVVEFVIPYSYDYSMTKWSTCRNRVFVNNVLVEQDKVELRYSSLVENGITLLNNNSYTQSILNGAPDYTEYNRVHEMNLIEGNRIDEFNWKKYTKHRTMVGIGHTFWGTLLLPTGIGWLFWCRGCDHKPAKYGNGLPRKATFDCDTW